MHRSSESVAAIATALAKAQTELSPTPRRRWSGRSTKVGRIAHKASATPVERPGHRAQGLRRAADRDRTDDRH
jgi:hypothetical protein